MCLFYETMICHLTPVMSDSKAHIDENEGNEKNQSKE